MRSNSAHSVESAVFGLVLGISCVVLGVWVVVGEGSTCAWLALALFVALLVVHVLRARRALRLRRAG